MPKVKKNTFDDYVHFFEHSLWVSFAGLLGLFIARLAFYMSYAGSDPGSKNVDDILSSFWVGFRFDLQVISYFNVLILFVISFYLVFRKDEKNQSFFRFLHYTYATIFLFFVLLSILDYYYYSYFLNRFDDLVFALIEDDTWAILVTMWNTYPVVTILLLTAFCYYLFLKVSRFFAGFSYASLYEKRVKIKKPVFHFFSFFLTFLLIWFMAARGSFGTFTLSVWTSPKVENSFLNIVSLNAPVALFEAIKARKKMNKKEYSFAKEYGYKNIDRAFMDYYGEIPKGKTLFQKVMRLTPTKTKGKKPHVVLIVMESFGSYYLKYHNESFNVLGEFENQLPRAVSFPYFVSSTGSTLGSITPLITGLPPMAGKRFLSEGIYKRTPVSCSPGRTYKRQGYETSFIYAGDANWRNMKDYYERQGLDNVYSLRHLEEFYEKHPGKKKDDQIKGTWGVFDEYLFEFALDKIKNAQKPQMIIILTTTNHPPYELPASYRPLSMNIPEELHEKGVSSDHINHLRFQVFQYSNHSLGMFLKSLEDENLRENSIVAVTGDHAFRFAKVEQNKPLIWYGVPLFMFIPDYLKPVQYNSNVIGYHGDIWPTLYNLSLSSASYCDLGKDLFDKDDEPLAMYMSSLYSSGGAILHKPGNIRFLFWAQPGITQKGKKTPELERVLTRYRALMSITEALLQEDYQKAEGQSGTGKESKN